jgi:hypothetical protein
METQEMIWLLLIVPGLLAAYFLFLRSILHKIPALQKFYDEADGFWAKVWALTGKSITMMWGYFLTAVGMGFELLDKIGPLVGDPTLDLKTTVTTALQNNPALLGYALMGISMLTILARVRSIGKE